eukprot:6040446-Alexandrium_andersonii.AAC.1
MSREQYLQALIGVLSMKGGLTGDWHSALKEGSLRLRPSPLKLRAPPRLCLLGGILGRVACIGCRARL